MYQYNNLCLHSLADKLQFNAFCKDRFTSHYLSADLVAPQYWKTDLLCILTDDLQAKASGFRKYGEKHQFLIKSGRHFRRDRNVNKIKKN